MKPDLIRIRTAEGRSRATASGQQMGRPPQLMPEQQGEVRKSGTEGTALKGNCSTPSRTVAMGRILAATAAFERLQVIFTRPNSPVAPILEGGVEQLRKCPTLACGGSRLPRAPDTQELRHERENRPIAVAAPNQ